MSSINASGDSAEKAHLGQAAWVVIGSISALFITFIVVVMLPTNLMPELATETAVESATSRPSHYNKWQRTPDLPPSSESPSKANMGIEQNSDTALSYGRATSTVFVPSLPQNSSR